MNGFPVAEKNHAEKAILHLRDLYPAAYAPVSLHDFPEWRPDGLVDPFVTNQGTIGPTTDRGKVTGDFHLFNVEAIGEDKGARRLFLLTECQR